MPKYKLRVVYKYSDIVEIEAPDLEAAKDLAPAEAEEVYECLYDVEHISTEEDSKP